MPTSEAKISANKLNAAKSTGPKTVEGKEKSRQNSFKHGLTGAGLVLPETDAIEIERRTLQFAGEMDAIDEVGAAFARRAAIHSVRMERAVDQQQVAMTVRIRQVEADFVAPEGADEAEAAKLLSEAIRFAMFNPSKEATLARQYEAAAERGFYRAVKQLRQMELQMEALLKARNVADTQEMVGSFIAAHKAGQAMDAEFDALYPEMMAGVPQRSTNFPYPAPTGSGVDVPFTIGRSR